ncbi:MAG: carboxypeptidase M32 [Ruminococcaceae bacterium]|nr:carboxypeptidase M32 [Oscillospiraceae bacterium]
MTVQEALRKLTELQEKLRAYRHATSLIYYDGVTTAPRGTAANRGQTLSILSGIEYELMTGRETVEILDTLSAHPERLDEKTARIVYLMSKDLKEMAKIPQEEYVAYQTLLVQADDVWHRAKEENDYAAFEPILAQIVDTHIRFAGYIAPDKHPYDHWLNQYEGGLTMEKCDAFFAALRERIVPLLKKIAAVPQVDDSILRQHFPEEGQRKLSDYFMEVLQLPRDHCGIATTEHPFTIDFSKYDVRITTHYYENDFASSMFSVVHEGGHALYELGVADEDAYNELGSGVSMGIHESQSRFYENLIGRSRGFIELIFPKLCEIFPEQFAGRTPEELYRAVNRVEPSLIRIEADELTYALHIMVRYEIERKLMNRELTTKDLPAEWNRLYKEYLGVDVPDDTHGCLQDSHWSGGSIGYFPSYALGSAYGAQLIEKMRETVDVDKTVASGDLAPINAWLHDHIWQYGRLYEPSDLFEKAVDAKFDPAYFTDYLEKKLSEIYGI